MHIKERSERSLIETKAILGGKLNDPTKFGFNDEKASVIAPHR